MRRLRTRTILFAIFSVLCGTSAGASYELNDMGASQIVSLPEIMMGKSITGDLDADARREIVVASEDLLRIRIYDVTSGHLEWESSNLGARAQGIFVTEGLEGGVPVVFVQALGDADQPRIFSVIYVAGSGTGGDAEGHPEVSAIQNAPNPLDRETTISFTLDAEGAVEVLSYDASGRLVRRIVDGRFGAGNHRIVWDGRDDAGRELAAGTYFYQLRIDGEPVGSSKAVVLR